MLKVNGLSHAEAKTKLKTHGYNELSSSQPKTIMRIGLETIKEPMFILLISCASLYMLIGDYREGAILLSSIFIIIYITFYQNRKSEKALEALKQLSSPRTLVLREGQLTRIASREIVPGDIIQVNEGDRISADAEIIDGDYIQVDESLLTGESATVDKSVNNSGEGKMLYSGTLVTRGTAWAKVIKTGEHTQFGQIGKSLNQIEEKTTRLQIELKRLIRVLFIASAFISVLIVVFYYYRSQDIYASLLNGLSASMALLPEEFPVVLTIFLALGAWKLSRSNVLTRKPSAIETLGSTTILCTDKTGTITQNKMMVKTVYADSKFIHMEAFNSSDKSLSHLFNMAVLATPEDSVDPMEKAIIQLGVYLSIHEKTLQGIKEYPFTQTHLMMARAYKLNESDVLMACKGAPEAIIEHCKLSEEATQDIKKAIHELAEKGYRVLGICHSYLPEHQLPENIQDQSYVFSGLLAFEDPIRKEVPDAVKECQQAGIKVVMITGDYPITASNIGMQIGLENYTQVLTGDDLRQISDEALRVRVNDVSIFARVKPEQKLRLVQAFKSNNEVVAMTGDGVNDAPALKAADIGIAMGLKGTDVAREAASLVLLDDNFASIVYAIRSGRRIYDNLQKAMTYIMAIHIPIIGLTLLPAIINLDYLLLMPVHIVFLELIIDPICSLAFESEQEEKGIMQRRPRDPNTKFFGWNKIIFSVFEGILLLSSVLVVYVINSNSQLNNNEQRTLVFTTLILGNIFLILSSLSKTRHLIDIIKEKNLSLILILSLACLVLMLSLSVPFIRDVFYFETPVRTHFILPLASAFSLFMLLEAIKIGRLWLQKRKAGQ